MHMPYPNYVPTASKEFNDYLREVMAAKSMKICDYLGCKYIVIHGFKLSRFFGSEELEWQETQKFLEFLAPFAAEYVITMCVENIYESAGAHIIEGPCCNAAKAVKRIDAMNDKYGAEVMGFCFETSPVLKSFPPELREDALRMIYKIGCYFGEKIETLH